MRPFLQKPDEVFLNEHCLLGILFFSTRGFEGTAREFTAAPPLNGTFKNDGARQGQDHRFAAVVQDVGEAQGRKRGEKELSCLGDPITVVHGRVEDAVR